MASGPPPSAAESSKVAEKPPDTPSGTGNTNASVPFQSQNPYASLATGQYSYQNYWQTTWPMYTGGASAVPQDPHYSQPTYAPYQNYTMPVQQPAAATHRVSTSTSGAYNHPASGSGATFNSTPWHTTSTPVVKIAINERPSISSSSPPPPPPLPIYEHWDEALRVFLKDAGMIQALKGFECDMMVMNAQWESQKIPLALEKLIRELSVCLLSTIFTVQKALLVVFKNTREIQSSPKGKGRELTSSSSSVEAQVSMEPEVDRSLEVRKLDYVHLENGEKARTPNSVRVCITSLVEKHP
jgi:hypothetical protein